MTVLAPEDFQAKYEVDGEVKFTEDLEGWLASRGAAKVYLNGGVNSDSGLENMLPEEKYWKGVSGVDKDTMYEVLAECRVTKTT
jgi:hypothetical protein